MPAKYSCLWRPAQSGKTKKIQEIIAEDEGMTRHLNIILCSNNRLLVAQTRVRMGEMNDTASIDSDATADDKIEGGVYSWMSGTKKTNISVRDLAVRVMFDEVKMIVCCSNRPRLVYIKQLIETLVRLRFSKPVNIWIDEADESVRLWGSAEFDFSGVDIVRSVTLVSATFDSVFSYYRRFRVKAYPDAHPETYRGLRDCNIIVEDLPARNSPDYVKAVTKKFPNLLRPGQRLFTPGDYLRASHNAIAETLTELGAVVLVLNGEEKGFRFPKEFVTPDGRTFEGGKCPISLSMDDVCPDELSHVLAEKYAELGLARYPFAVTGYLCLGRGITFQSAGFVFDTAIISNIVDASSAYQVVARVLGNTRKFAPISPDIFMNGEMEAATDRQERIAMKISVLVHEREWADVGLEEIGEAAGDAPRVRDYELSDTFSTLPAAKAWARENLSYGVSQFNIYDVDGVKCIRYRGENRPLMTEAEVRGSTDLGQGANDKARVMPVRDIAGGIADSARAMPVKVAEEKIGYIVIYKKDKRIVA